MTQSVGRYDYRESTRECDACNKNPTCVGFVDDATERYCTFKDAVEGDDMVDDVGRDSYKKLEVTSYYVPHFNKWVGGAGSEDERGTRKVRLRRIRGGMRGDMHGIDDVRSVRGLQGRQDAVL